MYLSLLIYHNHFFGELRLVGWNTKQFDPPNSPGIFRGIFRGLGHLHQHGLTHGDIKPENVLLEWKDYRQLLSKHARNPKAPGSETKNPKTMLRKRGESLGTPFLLGFWVILVVGWWDLWWWFLLLKAWLSVKKSVHRWKCPTHFKTAWTRHQLIAHVRIIDLDTVSRTPQGQVGIRVPGSQWLYIHFAVAFTLW